MWAEPLYTAEEMRAAEEAYDGPTLELMERAGKGVAEAVLRDYPGAQRIAVWCGTGANGGDGLVVARELHQAGREAVVRLLGAEEKVTGDAGENLRRAREVGVPLVDEQVPVDVVVDALFGTGFSGAPRREAAGAIDALNAGGEPIVAVDLPSGVNASTGEVAGTAVRAARTVTFHGPKLGLVVAPGRFHAGEVEVVDIGLEPKQTRNARVSSAILDASPAPRPGGQQVHGGCGARGRRVRRHDRGAVAHLRGGAASRGRDRHDLRAALPQPRLRAAPRRGADTPLRRRGRHDDDGRRR